MRPVSSQCRSSWTTQARPKAGALRRRSCPPGGLDAATAEPGLFPDDQHWARRVSGEALRDASEQNAIEAITPMAANHDEVSRPIAGSSDNQLYRVADGN